MSSDDEELAAIRQQRKQALGESAGATLVSCLNSISHINSHRTHPFDTHSNYSNHQLFPTQTSKRHELQSQISQIQRHHHDNDTQDDQEEDELPDPGTDIDPSLRAFFPMSFGGTKPSSQPGISKQPQREEEDDFVGPPPPPADDDHYTNKVRSLITNPYSLPISSEAILHPHSRIVTALHLDPGGARLLSASNDNTLSIFDFGGMSSDLTPFRTLTPEEGHPVIAVSWSPLGDAFLAVTTSPQPRVYDREGSLIGECSRGDVYMRDLKNTRGHISRCTGGQWHPVDRDTVVTCSDDGSVRIWNVLGGSNNSSSSRGNVEQVMVVKPTLARPGRVAVTCCAYSTNGHILGAGLMDGTIQLWDVRKKGSSIAGQRSAGAGGLVQSGIMKMMKAKPTWSVLSGGKHQLLRGAHEADGEITCLKFSTDGHALISRGGDETLKVWDLRKFQQPLAVFRDLPSNYSNTQCCFSPNEDLILTCTSSSTNNRGSQKKKEEEGEGEEKHQQQDTGCLVFIDKKELKLIQSLAITGTGTGTTNGGAVAVQWHPKINQILVGAGDRKSGAVHVLYDSELSEKGVMMAAGRRPRPVNPFDFTTSFSSSGADSAGIKIYNPNALPLFREDMPGFGGGGGRKRKEQEEARERAGERTAKSFKPEVGQAAVGVGGVGAKGKLGTSQSGLLTQYLMKTQGLLKKPVDDDVRASILRHAGKEGEFSRLTAVYKKTQPEKIFAVEEEEEGDGGEEEGEEGGKT
jgi:WD40 repeat protein